jgi:hypothetical protein
LPRLQAAAIAYTTPAFAMAYVNAASREPEKKEFQLFEICVRKSRLKSADNFTIFKIQNQSDRYF